jgi:hypothetical protein
MFRCSMCGSVDGTAENPIVMCDRCNTSVHKVRARACPCCLC